MTDPPPDPTMPGAGPPAGWPPPTPVPVTQPYPAVHPAYAANQPHGPAQPHFPTQPLFPAYPPVPAYPPPQIPSPPRRHRGMFWVAVLAALAVLIGGTVVAVTAHNTASTPGAVAKDYFRALGRADAPAALALGDLPAGPRTFLTSDVLRAALKVGKLSDVTVLSVARHGDTADVAVQYQLHAPAGAVVVNDTVHLTRRGHDWRIDATAVPTRLALPVAGRRLTLAGAAVPQGDVLLFPGALPVTADTPNLDVPTRVVHLHGFVPRIIEPEVSDQGERAVTVAVGAAVQACLDAKARASCPAPSDERAIPGTVRGTLPADVGAKLDITVGPGPDGLLIVHGTVDVHGSYQRLDFNNLPVDKSGTVHLVIHAQCYATDPSKLVWRSSS